MFWLLYSDMFVNIIQFESGLLQIDFNRFLKINYTFYYSFYWYISDIPVYINQYS